MARRRSRKNVVNPFLGAMGAAACYAAIKRFLNLFIKKQYYMSNTPMMTMPTTTRAMQA